MFASGYAACFVSALHFVAAKAGQKIPGSASVTTAVDIGPRGDGKGVALSIALTVGLPGAERDGASSLMQQAHLACPYSNLTRNGSKVGLTLA